MLNDIEVNIFFVHLLFETRRNNMTMNARNVDLLTARNEVTIPHENYILPGEEFGKAHYRGRIFLKCHMLFYLKHTLPM